MNEQQKEKVRLLTELRVLIEEFSLNNDTKTYDKLKKTMNSLLLSSKIDVLKEYKINCLDLKLI